MTGRESNRFVVVLLFLTLVAFAFGVFFDSCMRKANAAPIPVPREGMIKPPWFYLLTGKDGTCTLNLGSHGDYLYHFRSDGSYTAKHHAYEGRIWRVSGSWRWLSKRQVLQVTEPEHDLFPNGMAANYVVREIWFYERRDAVILGETVYVTLKPR